MLPYINEKNVGGYCYKNVTIPMENNRTTYNIATQFNLGLPPTSIMCGVAYRIVVSSERNSPTSINNRPILPVQYLGQGFITIRDIETYDIVSNQPLFTGISELNFKNETGYVDAGIIWHEPRRIGEVDWQRSIVYFPEWLIFGDDTLGAYDLELQIIYYNPNESSKIAPQLSDRTGFMQEGLRSKQIEVIEGSGKQYYSFAKNSTIGIDPEALITGIGLSYYNKISYSNATKGIGLGSSFITIKDRYRTIVDSFSIQLAQSLNTISLEKNFAKYLPVQPTRVCDFDWEGSQLFISNPTSVTENASDVFQIFYVQPIYK